MSGRPKADVLKFDEWRAVIMQIRRDEQAKEASEAAERERLKAASRGSDLPSDVEE